MKAFINLFKAIPISKNGQKNASKDFLNKTVRKGFIFSPEVIFNYSENELNAMINEIETIIGLDSVKMNTTFHKSWNKIKTSSIEELFIEQCIHYLTTYGFESLGIYDKNLVYIPTEKLKVPNINIDKIPLIVIKGYTIDKFKEKIFDLLKKGIALSKNTKTDIINVTTTIGFNEEELSKIKNKEVRVILYDFLNIIPKNPIEFLRFAIYISTQKTLLIKDKETIDDIKKNKNIKVVKFFKDYSKLYGLENLAEIFFRFKPLFLAFRTNLEMKKIINKIRRLATIHHKPMPEDFLNNVTAYTKNGNLDLNKLKEELKKVNIFRKVRLAYSLKFRICDPDNIMYKIRNGKTFVTDLEKRRIEDYKEPLNIILQSISDGLKEKVFRKKIYIPKEISYTLPSTEKQFVGNFPSGTCITIPKNMIFGIHWFNVNQSRIDLDLSLINTNGEKIGWNTSIRSNSGDILFSGDITDAPLPNGATELFYVKTNGENNAILFVNYYNFTEDIEVPFKIVVGKINRNYLPANYMINPNNVISVENSKINTKQKILGLLVTTKKDCKFYYIESNLYGSIVSKNNNLTNKTRQFLFDFYFGTITLNEVLEIAGAELVDSKENCDIDLSPETLEKDTLINLIS